MRQEMFRMRQEMFRMHKVFAEQSEPSLYVYLPEHLKDELLLYWITTFYIVYTFVISAHNQNHFINYVYESLLYTSITVIF